MHWRLSTKGPFSLRKTIRQSSWMLHAPFQIIQMGSQLLRIERISREKIIPVVFAQSNQTLIIHTTSNLSGSEIEELTKRTRRMLRLSEDFKPFYNLIYTKPVLHNQDFSNPVHLRGSSLFEDIIRATTLAWDIEGTVDANKYTWLVDHFGDPLPSNPTLHAFPEPTQILEEQEAIIDQFQPSIGDTIIHVANIFETQPGTIDSILEQQIPSSALSEELNHLLHLDDAPLSQVMLSLGRYDYIPTDPLAQARWHRFANQYSGPQPADIRQHFEDWQPWGGLAYWLWDWQPVTEIESFVENDNRILGD